jgi:hypothetical protein
MKKEGYKTLGLLTLLVLVLAACNQAAAKCPCSSGGSASYNFLGDPAVDVDMDSYADFVQANAQHCSVDVLVPTPENAAQSALTLDLGRRGKIEVRLSPKDGTHIGQGNLTGLGNLTQEDKAEQLEATGFPWMLEPKAEISTVSSWPRKEKRLWETTFYPIRMARPKKE